jgi:hypothetical protein
MMVAQVLEGPALLVMLVMLMLMLALPLVPGQPVPGWPAAGWPAAGPLMASRIACTMRRARASPALKPTGKQGKTLRLAYMMFGST